MYEVSLSQEIAASTDRVWDVITSFREYDEWNPIITKMRATLVVGAPVSFLIAIGGRTLKIQAEMQRVEHGRELCWCGPRQWLLGRLFRGEHYLRVEHVRPGTSRLHHGERFLGATVPFLWNKVRREVEPAYEEMNRALKARAESAWLGPASSERSGRK